MATHATALLALVLMTVIWLVVQRAWGRVFPPGKCSDPDVLAGRMGCHGCDSTEVCDRRLSDRAGSAEEELS